MEKPELIIGMIGGLLLFFVIQGYNIMPAIFFIVMIGAFLLFTRTRSGNKSFATAPDSSQTGITISFDDIGGQEVAKNELKEALEFVKDIDRLHQLGIRPLKGILLNGPPGTGKTLLAKAAAHYTDSIFLTASGSEFVEMYVGVGAQRVRQLFTQARRQAKAANKDSAVIFIDEIEVLGGKRGQANSNLEYDQTLNELLVQLDGLAVDDQVRTLVVAATNRMDVLDPALLRPGRFDRHVRVDLPDKKGRIHILELHTRNKPLAPDVCLESIAADTFGFSGSHLENISNEAAIMALRDNQTQITAIHFKNAIEKVMLGEKLDRLPSLLERQRIAVHEAGHAIVSELKLPGSVASINVASRSNALGYVRQTQIDDIYLYPLALIENKIAVALAGAIAEEITFGNRSTGASNDFKVAVDYAKQIIYGGMSVLGIVSPQDIPQELLHNTITAILHSVEAAVLACLTQSQDLLAEVSQLLLKKESISGTDFRQLIAEWHSKSYADCHLSITDDTLQSAPIA